MRVCVCVCTYTYKAFKHKKRLKKERKICTGIVTSVEVKSTVPLTKTSCHVCMLGSVVIRVVHFNI